MAANKNTDWRAKYRAMMTDPDFANKASEAVENTRKVNTNLMNKSEGLESSLSLDKPKQQPLDLSRVQEMQTEQAARATMQGEDSDYSGVSDLATKLYAEERKKRIDNAQQGSNTYFGAPHGMRFSQAAADIRDEELAKRVQGIYDKVLKDESLSQAIHSNANKALLNAMEKNQSMSEDEQKKVYNESVTKQLEAIGKGIDKYLYDTNAPKSEAEWIAKNAVNSSIMGQMLTSPMDVEGGENAYRQQALADYGANASWLSQGLSTAGSLVIDTLPMMGIGTAFAAPASKAAMWGVGKVGGKALQGSLAGRGFVGMVGGAANLGGYNAASALTSQFSNGQFDLGEIASSAGHGAIMGGLTGVMSPVLRGLSQGMGKVGKVATMAGGLGAEAGIFTAAELAEMENPYDFETIAQTFGKNVAVIGGLKLSNLPKTLQEYKSWYNEGKQSNFTDADYKIMADFAKANGFANNDAFSMSADGTYSRSIADRATGGRNILTMTKLEGGKERNLAMEMYQDPNVPLSMKTKIAAKMGLPAPNPVLPNAVEARDNVVNTYYEYREQMADGTYVTRRILVDSKEMPSKRKARAAASEFGRTKARQNSIIQSEAEANTDATNAIVMARLTEQAWRSGTNVSDEVARMYDIAQRAQRGEASAEDIAYYQSVMEGTTEVTDNIKADIKAKTGVDIDEVLKQEGTFNTAQDKALTMYTEALASLKDSSKPTTERGTTASQASIADYIELKGMGIEQTKQLLNDPAAKVAAEKDIRNKYALWLKYFDGQMTEEQLASRLGYNLDSTKGLMDFVNEESFFRGKAANRIAYNAANAAKRLLEQGSGGVRFTDDNKVKLQGVPYSIAVDESIVDRYRAAQQGSGENYQRIANDALKDIIRQSEQPIEELAKPMVPDEQPIDAEPQTEQEAVTQQMVDTRMGEIDTDLQGIEADGIQRVSINDKPAMIVKGRIATLGNGEIDRTKSSTEVAYIPLDENGRPIKNEQGKPVVEVGVKPSNVRISEVEQWRTIEDYKRAEEQRIRDNNRITDEAIAQVGAEDGEVKEEMPTLDNVVVEPKDADELVAMCDGDKGLALDVAVDELAKAQAAKGKGASTAETIDINRRIRTYQQIVDRLSASEMPDAAAVEVEAEQKGEQAKAEPQVTDDMEFIYQGLDENHEGMEPMQMADGRYKWVGLQRGELTATMGERDVELLDGLAKKLGVAIIPIDVADSAVNGYYRDGNIYVNTNRGADWTMRWVAGHELLHDVAKKSPEAYDAYKQAVLDMWGSDYIDDQVKQIIDDYAASGKTIDREQALTELVNDFGGELFNSRDGLNILDNILKDESRKGNTGFVNTIKQWWERLKEFFGGTPYYNEAQKMLEQAYKDAMQNVDYKAREEQLSKDMDDAFFGEPDVVKPKVVETELKETKDFTPTKMPSGTAIEDKPGGDFSVKSIMRGVGIDAQTDGDNVWFEKDGRTFSKAAPMSVEESKSGILKDMVDQCKELGLMDDAKAEDVYKMYTDIVNKIIEKADGSFADLNNQYLWLGETVYRVVHSNSDKQYKRSLDVTLVCKKNEAVIRGISELQRRQGFGVTPSQIMQLYYSTLDKGYQVPCPVCYVFSRYIQNGQYTSNLVFGHHLYDNNPYFRNPAEMTPAEKAEAEAYWLKEYKRVVKEEEKNKKLIDACKSVMSWATKEMDKLMLEATTGSNKTAKRNEYKKRAAKLDTYYRAAINLVAKADMSGYITSVITKPIVKDKKVVGMEMREDAGQVMTPEVEEAILDYRKVALAKTKYPHISRYIASKGSAAGKGYNFESDNPMGDVLQQLATDSSNYYQEATNTTSEKERAKLLKKAKDRTEKSAQYAARQTLRGGVRQWSWSDNIEALAPDVALNAMQVGMLGGAMQTYSKQLEGIEMMAAMNAYVNGSLMGKGMGYQKVSADFNAAPKWQDPNTGDWYTLHFDDVVGVRPYSRNGKLGLFDLNDMYDRAGNILVGMNDIHVRTAMADPRIFFIIPWHASGMSDHILKQMNAMLKLDMAGFKASDYTKHQEEKMYENKVKKQKDENGVEIEVEEIAEIPASTTRLWRTHDYSDRFLNNDGTQAKIALTDGQLSADQLHYRELRDAVLMHSNAENASDTDKAFWAEHQDWLAEIKNDVFLNQVLESVTNGPGRFGIAMTTEDCGFVYPYEYWDKASTYDGADVNGQRYVEYCRRLGIKPKFSGVDGKAGEYGNFVDDSGYWKLLIDRRMYDREGKYQDLTPVDPSGFKADFIDQDKTATRFPVTVVADKEATSDIVDDVQYNELKVYNDKPLEVDYEQTVKDALKEAKSAEKKYAEAKQLIQLTKKGTKRIVNQKELYQLELDRLAKKESLADVENDNFLADEGAEMSIVRDRNKIEELEGEELVPMYRTFQILDGALYSPMATIQRGKKVHSVVEGDWWKSDENADLAKVKVKGKKDEFYDKDDDRISKKDGKWVITIDGEDKPLAANGNSLSYYFNLKKGEKGDVVTDDLYAAYNPYIHASRSALNDQFKGAYLRPNLVLAEVLVPKSELDGTNRYKADYAKDGIGEVDWNSGTVIKQAVAAGHPGRKVALSRYAKIGKVFTNAEWADKIDEELSAYKGQITLPFIAFPPDVLRELANRGYKVEPPTSKKAQPYYEAWLKGEEPTDPNGGGKPTEEFSIKADKEKQLDIINRTNPAPDDYHTWIRTTNDIKTLQEAVDEVKAEDPEYDLSSYPDVTDDMINKALQSGKVTVYSSYPIKEGVFVSPSKMQAKDYAGGGKVYSKQVSISDVAWINTDEGMFAPTEYSVKDKRADESVLDYAKRVSEANADADYSIKIRGKEYRNDGYTQREDGTNVSIRALDAEENGTYPKGIFTKVYGVSRKDFDTLADLGVIENTEWHHTGTNFNKTDYFSWADSDEAKDGDVDYSDLSNLDAQSMGARYKANKKEINSLINKYNESEWGALPKMKRSIPTLEAFTERYVTNATGITSSDQWLTSAERKQKAENHNEVSASATMRDSYERYLTHKYIDELYYETAEKHKNDWIEAHSEEIQNEYNSLKKEVDEYNLAVKPIAEVYSNHAKGKYLMQALELLGYSPEDAAEIIASRHKSDNWDSYTRKAEMARDAVNKEYDEKIETAQKNLDKWLSKAVKDGKAEFVERVATKPEYFITTKEEMNGRYGWFEATSRYNLPTYYSGYKFESKRMFDSYKRRTGQITDIRREASSKAVDAYNTELDKRYAAEFSIKGGNTPKKQADEVARLKQRIEQLSQEKDAIAEDGAKVKDIASEMTSFIKQNISTEVQSDMTRNQFKGILNQLENAVTKKDLEKPMQMIEHIGTNVTRRSLTRQMRTFLKSEFKAMTPQGAVKAKTVDGATSRVLELAKTMYATMNKLPLGGEVAALQKQMRDLKADATEWANDQSADTKNLLADVLKVTERPAATRYSELAELRNKVAADGSASGEMLGYIDHMLDIMGDIDYFRGEQQKAKEASALNSKEDLEALKSELLDKSDKGILSEEDKAVLDNMPLYEMMVNLRQQQLDIDGGGAASIDAQIRNKQNAIKAYRAKMNELPKTDTTGRERYKKLIEQVGGEIDDLFASRIVDQKAVNNGMRELIDDLVTLKEQGHSRLVEWSKNKQQRILDVKQLANNSFSASARGYWDEVNKSGHRLRDINNFLNNAKLTVISPALSFEYMLGTLDKKYYTNDSPIYNRFIKSQDGLLKANDNFFEGLESYNKEVNAAANRLIGRGAITNMAEWFKLGDRFATKEIPFAFEVDQMFDDGTVRKVTKGITATMTRGQAAKIYAWSRMTDGMAKLKAHGVTDETIAAVKDFIGEGYMNFVDWVEDDFFPRLRREKYNPKYKEIYGISMAENEHYFPFAIYKKDVRTDTDLEQIGDDKLGGGLVGNLIERKRNNARLDFTRNSPDIFDMITRYGETMEEWTAYAQVREDLKAMVNDKMFKVKCDMFGTGYYKRFLEAARVASRTSDDKALAGEWNTTMSKLQKVLASSAISMRVSTALKQLLSAPAFAVYSLDPKFLHQLEKTVVPIDVESAIKGLWKIGSGDLQEAKKLLLNENWVGHYNWCVNNLPSFRERVSLGGAGNPILEEKSFDNFFGKLCDAVQSAGMIPNRLVDAFTCSVGAKAVYEYNFNKYKKMYGEKTAHNMAVTEAEIAFNSSQQSSNPVFLSPMQVSKQFFLRGLMNFKNSPIGYLRAGLKANTDIVRAIKSIYNPTFKVDGQEMRFNSNGKNAASMLMTSAARSAMYNFYLNFIWNFGVYGIAGFSYTTMRNLSGEGNEDGNLLYSDEEWKKATGDNLAATLFLCATQGIPYISGPFATAEQGTEFAPLMLLNTLNEMGTDIYQSGLVSPVTAQWITNIALKNGVGIDPQVCAQVYEGLQGILADRPVTEEDIMNLLASPRSAISGMTKQKVGEFDRMRDYVDARIKSNREIGIDERMDFGKALAGKRELRKSNLDYYIDEYLEANIPGYREISGRKSKETKQEEQANKKLYEQSMSLVEKIVSTPKGEANEQKTSKIDSKDEDIKYMVRRLRDAVAAIHKLYAAGDYSTAEDIATEMKRRIERGYDPNGKTLDERLKNVDIWEPVGKVNQDSPDGYYTNFDRAIGGEFKRTYVGKMNSEGN